MLTNTFLHIPYISEKIESELWQNNIRCWDDFLSRRPEIKNSDLIEKHLTLSKENYLYRNHVFFSQKIERKHHWRAYDDFKDRCCYLDIETTGLSRERSDLTVVGVYDGNESKVFIKGKNMDDFREEIKKYKMIVTFNGALFDVPFLQAKFPDLNIDQFHVDLRWTMKSLGYSGGLKNIEKELGIERESDLSGMTGRDAIKLWKKYKNHGDEKALDILVRYNIEDIENLKYMMDFSYEKLKGKCFDC